MNQRIIITGDVVHSRSQEIGLWMPELEQSLRLHTQRFDVFRGDSFQAEVTADQLFTAIFHLKATLRSFENMDVRLGIGIGEISYVDADIKKASGTAFVYSGEAFDHLGKESILFKSENEELDALLNLTTSLACLIAEQWTVNMAESVKASLENPEASQQELLEIIGRKHQSQLSLELRKANYAKIQQVIRYCTQELRKHA